VSSARQLFEVKGFSATSVQSIVDGAGLTKGAFYYHFVSKEELLRIIHDEYIDHQLELVRTVLASTDDPGQQLRGLIRTAVEAVEQYRSHVAVFLGERRFLSEEGFAEVKVKRDEVENVFYGVLQRAQQAGLIKTDLEPRVVSLGVIGMCAWAYQWYSPDGKLTAAEVADTFTAMVWEGIAAQ
jgi:AcrR family transcriptional regulator